MPLLLPPSVIAERRLAHASAIDAGTTPDPLAEQFTRTLRRIDPRLMMVRAQERVPPGCPLRPGFYHLLRRNDDAPISVFPIHEHEQFVVPDSRVFDRLAAGDLHDPRTLRDWNHAQQASKQTVKRDQARANNDRREHLHEVVNAATRAQVSMDRSVPWTQSSNAKRPA
jgi:hypothetical protein